MYSEIEDYERHRPIESPREFERSPRYNPDPYKMPRRQYSDELDSYFEPKRKVYEKRRTPPREYSPRDRTSPKHNLPLR